MAILLLPTLEMQLFEVQMSKPQRLQHSIKPVMLQSFPEHLPSFYILNSAY